MERGGGAGGADTGGAGGSAPPGTEGSASPAAPQAAQPHAGTAPAAAQDTGTAEPGQDKAGGNTTEPGQETALAAPELRDAREAAPGEEDSAAQCDGGRAAPDEGQAASTREKVPAAAEAQGAGKDEKEKPGEKKAPAAGEAKRGKASAAAKAKDGGEDEPMEGKGLAATEAQDGGKDKPTKEEAPGGSGAESGGKAESTEEKALAAANSEEGKAKPVEETALAAAQAQGGGKGEPVKEKITVVAKQEVPATGKALDEGKQDAKAEQAPADTKPAKEKTTAAAKEKAPNAAKAQNGKNKVVKAEKAPAVKKAPGGGKEEPTKEKPPAPVKEKAPAPVKEKAPAPVKEKAPIPAKEKAPDAAKAQDGEKAAAKAEKTPAEKMAQGGGKKEPAKEKSPAAVKVQDGGKNTAKVEKATAGSKAGDEGKDSKKEKVPATAKAQDGGKKAAEVEPPTPGAEAGDGAVEPTEAAAMPAVKAQGEGEEVSKGTEGQPPTVPEPPRPVLLQSLSCPAACRREEQPWAEVAEMETIEEETTMVEPKEGPTEPGSGPPALGDLQPLEPPGAPQERTLPSATGQPPDPAGVVEQPGPGVQPSLTEAKPPPSPYLTPDFGKEDPFEILDDVPPPPAPFAHRTVTLRSASVSSQFSLSSKDILGGGKFGEVHTCTEKETGLKLAAKVIRKQGAKDKEMVLLEIDVMNQLNHHNLIQLYDAIETPREIILFMEFVEGGELFERIIDDDYHLTEVDCMVFVRQICEGIRFMHHMGVLHLDLKPENILCVSATGHMVKIIDFGLARRYNPNEKLKVNFGTPEFLSPEVVNYEQVSYSTDMWSMGVITYMLLSGLSPFLGDDDTETLNNVLAANWYFDEETFESVSNEAKDFVSNLIIKDKSARMSADQCLQHPWLNNLAEKAKRSNRRLKSQVLLKKYVMRRRWKKNFIGVCAANRFRKITSSGSLTALGI
ncbi:myosin light chain kinase 2, skeletal/cardiac muscle [Motacilla alba alba]|uniref:myosin light chain kinase 2, skeletal/cardiac muscle n=1 Tax=Motacilla alba alba TaxID=1094192 RepID=UPI0018D58EF6|nr:myosin light chain kinase 2, skeletal/cardiac muscle [Motacilla alba alba]XP_038014902.1 myosin light chain kinase 2, skeletal/cardiac muscle [Motacilla alba alba]